MGTDLKKVGSGSKAAIALCGVGAVCGILLLINSWIITGILLIAGCIVGGVVNFKKLLAEYARAGKRF